MTLYFEFDQLERRENFGSTKTSSLKFSPFDEGFSSTLTIFLDAGFFMKNRLCIYACGPKTFLEVAKICRIHHNTP